MSRIGITPRGEDLQHLVAYNNSRWSVEMWSFTVFLPLSSTHLLGCRNLDGAMAKQEKSLYSICSQTHGGTGRQSGSSGGEIRALLAATTNAREA